MTTIEINSEGQVDIDSLDPGMVADIRKATDRPSSTNEPTQIPLAFSFLLIRTHKSDIAIA